MASKKIGKIVECQANGKVGTKSITTPPPDGGWGWVIVFASFMIQAITNGVEYSFGLFFTKIANSDEIASSKSEVAWIGSIMLGASFGAGIVASVFVNIFGCRAVCIAGGLIASFGFGISYWADGVLYLYLSAGVIGGLGLGLNFLPVVVCTAQYFEKRRALATGIAICGAGFGTFTLTTILNFLISWLGWRAAFLGVAAITLLTLPLAALLRPLPTPTTTSIATEGSDDSKLQNTIINTDLNLSSTKEMSSSDSNCTSTSVGRHVNPSFISSLDNILEVKSALQDLKSSDDNGHIERILGSNGHENETIACQNRSSWLKTLFAWSLFQNPIFLLFLLSNFLTNMGVYVPYIYYADMARRILGTEEGDPTLGWLVSFMGIASIFGRIIISYLSDTKYVNRLYVYGGSLVLCGVGLLFDMYKEYTYGFWLAGLSVTVSGFLMFLIPLLKALREGERDCDCDHYHYWLEGQDHSHKGDLGGKLQIQIVSLKRLPL